jgi:hypothetical protein
MVMIATEQLTLLWDAPLGAVDHYTVYYRVHGSSDWITLADVPAAPLPEYTAAHSVVGDGEFDFAVVSVDAAAQRSPYHTSLDTTAQPQSAGMSHGSVPKVAFRATAAHLIIILYLAAPFANILLLRVFLGLPLAKIFPGSSRDTGSSLRSGSVRLR